MDFFVVGTSRTGSTLLRHMLDAHPNCAVLNESHWIPEMWERFGAGEAAVDELLSIVEHTFWDSGRRVVEVSLDLTGRTWEHASREMRARLGLRARVSDFHDALVDAVFGAAPGSVQRGDKTPDYGFYMTTLQQIWPGARFVHIVRNGIETARSMATHPGCQLMISAGYDNWVPLSYNRRFEQFARIELPFAAYVASWRRRMLRIRSDAAALEPGSYLEVRYEDLIESSELVLRRVVAHLGLPTAAEWIETCSAMVRLPPRRDPVSEETLRGLTAEDLDALDPRWVVGILAPPQRGH